MWAKSGGMNRKYRSCKIKSAGPVHPVQGSQPAAGRKIARTLLIKDYANSLTNNSLFLQMSINITTWKSI